MVARSRPYDRRERRLGRAGAYSILASAPSSFRLCTVQLPDDPGVVSVLRELGITADALLGHGGEAWVYALGDDRVVRVLHPGGSAEDLLRRQRLVDGLSQSPPPFALPE